MSTIKKIEKNDQNLVKDYIYNNFWGCIEIAKIFDKNGCNNRLTDKNSGDFLGFFSDDETLEGLFVFTNNKRFLLHYLNKDVTKKVDLLKAIKLYKPEFMSGVSDMVDAVWQMFERTVKRYKYSKSMYMVLDNHQDLMDDFLPDDRIREANEKDAMSQTRFFLELEKHFKRNHMTINQMQTRIKSRMGKNEYLVIEDGSSLTAQGFVEDKINAFSQIGGVYTTPKFRGHGYGKKIVEHLSYHIIDKGSIPILAVLKDNSPAIHVYETLGFSEKKDFSIIEIEF